MNENLSKQLDAVIKNIESRSVAEKLAVFLLVLTGLVLGYLSLLSDPLQADIDNARSQIASVMRQIQAQQSSYTEMLDASREDPNKFANERLAVVERELEQLSREIGGLAGDLITPTDMTRILTSVLERQSGLELISFQNIEASPLRTDAASASGNEDGVNSGAQVALSGQVFQHGLRIQFQGDYFSTLKYLRFIEQISGSFFWDSITFQQFDWPQAMVTLQIHTISTDSGFIGV